MAPPLDLKDLRNLSKRDPSGYHAEFLLQYRHFQTQLQIFLLKPAEDYKPFSELVEYLCHVSDIYAKDMPDFPEQISNLLEKNCDILASPLRRALVSSLILLRSKNQITPHSVLSLFFKLFKCPDAQLREILYKHIVNDISNINKKHKNQNLNHALQNFMFTMMKDPNEMAAKQSLNVTIELYRKRIWNDPKTVNVISSAVFAKSTGVVVAALKFFLTVAADDEEDRIAEQKERAALTIKKTNLKMNVKKMGRRERRRNEEVLADAQQQKVVQRKLDPNWPAIELINDPQGYTEKVFAIARHSFDRIEVKLMLMNFISRLIFTHKLLVLNFYPFVQKYLMPKNEHVTYALSILAQCVHELVPPTDLQPIVRHLVDKFVHDRSSNESIVCGLHTLREMCNRNPLIMDDTLLRDLSQYKNNKDKAVTTAARGLIAVYRLKNPELLARADRGKVGNMNKEKPLAYGEVKVSSGIEGIELLEAVEKIQELEKRQSKKTKKAAELDLEGNVIAYESDEEDDDEDDEDGWMEVDGEGEDSEEDGEEDDAEESEEEDQFVKTVKQKGTKGGVVPTHAVMTIADALKLQQHNMEIIEHQRAEQLRNREKRKRGEIEEEEEEEEEDEDEDEDEEEDDEDEDEDEDESEEEKEQEPDIWTRIEMASAPQAAANGHANGKVTPAKPEPSKPVASKIVPTKTAPAKNTPVSKSANAKTAPAKTAPAKTAPVSKTAPAAVPPKKKVKVDVVEVDSEEEEAELEEIDSDSDEGEWEEVNGEEIEDDSDEGEWVTMEDDESEEGEEEEEEEVKVVKKQAQKQPKKKAVAAPTPTPANGTEKTASADRIDQVRILTEEDYEKLAKLKEMKAEGRISLARLKELSQEDENSDEDDGTGIVDPSSLTRGIKTPRKKGEELMKEILEKRNNREKRTKIKTRFTTNTENTKRKNIIMVTKGKKQHRKAQMSWRDQQIKQQAGKEKFKKRRHK